jgi:hypothetical protein
MREEAQAVAPESKTAGAPMSDAYLELVCLVVSHACIFSIGKPARDLNLEKQRQPFGIVPPVDQRRCPQCGLMREPGEGAEDWECPGYYLHDNVQNSKH